MATGESRPEFLVARVARVARVAGRAHEVRRARAVKGFTLIELLIVMAVLSILAGIAVPRLLGAIVKAEAADVIGDMNVIKVAVLTYQSDRHAWPEEVGPGQAPRGLEEYLPAGFTFQKEDYVLDYENRSGGGRSGFNVGVAFVTENLELGLTVVDLVGSHIFPNGATKFTWIIES